MRTTDGAVPTESAGIETRGDRAAASRVPLRGAIFQADPPGKRLHRDSGECIIPFFDGRSAERSGFCSERA